MHIVSPIEAHCSEILSRENLLKKYEQLIAFSFSASGSVTASKPRGHSPQAALGQWLSMDGFWLKAWPLLPNIELLYWLSLHCNSLLEGPRLSQSCIIAQSPSYSILSSSFAPLTGVRPSSQTDISCSLPFIFHKPYP